MIYSVSVDGKTFETSNTKDILSALDKNFKKITIEYTSTGSFRQ